MIAETLPEPVKLREAEAKDEAKLSDFQEELVQMAAVLCGDHRKEGFPQKLIEEMTVAHGVDYVKDMFERFLDECERARRNGADESTICIPESASSSRSKSKSFASKLFSCISCKDH